MNQNHAGELDWLAERMKRVGCCSYLEIGCRNGVSIDRLVLAGAIVPGGRIVAVDRPGGPWGVKKSGKSLVGLMDRLEERGFDTHTILADSSFESTIATVRNLGPFDVIYIDADHRYEAVKLDWKNYGPLAMEFTAFDDIAGEGQKSNPDDPDGKRIKLGVYRLWAELKKTWTSEELVLPKASNMPTLQGIGIVYS